MAATHPGFTLTGLFKLGGLAILSTLGPTVYASADETWLDVNVTSWHSEETYRWERQERRYNSSNFGLGIGRELTDYFEVKAGWFDNSYEKTSVYAIAAIKHDLLGSPRWVVAPGAAVGLVSGYQNTPEQTAALTPWGLLTLTLGKEHGWRAMIGYMPSRLFQAGTVDIVTLQISLRL